jgi:3'-5' exoribonuclease
MQRVKVSDLKPKIDIESVYLIKYLQLAQSKDGKDYLNIILSDATGDIEGRMWSNAHDLVEKFDKGNFIGVKGKANIYQGKKQFIIQEFFDVNKDEINETDFVYQAQTDANEMFSKLQEHVNTLDDVYVKELLNNILNDQEIQRRLKSWQAGKSIHHAYKSGLLEHILSCVELSMHLSAHYKVNKNYVVAGAILHDLCKIYELSDGYNVDYTEEGKLVGHLVKGVEILDKFAYRIKGFPYDLKMHLKHILLSHHGYYEYGSPKIPQTSEAMLLHLIDHMDSKMHSFETVKRTDQNSGHWSGFVKHLDRIIYKSELPFYPEYLEIQDRKSKAPAKKSAGKSQRNQEVKQNLGNLLKDFKVED